MKIVTVDTQQDLSAVIHEICSLFNRVYPGKFTVEYIRWRFFSTPFERNQNVAAYVDSKMVGYAALSARPLVSAGERIWAAQSLGSVVDPCFQRKGIYSAMAEFMYERALEHGVAFIWGFPNPNSHYGRKIKLKWQDIYEIPTKRLCFEKLQDVIQASPTIQEMNAADWNVDLYQNKATLTAFNHFVRDRTYCAWRYGEYPGRRYRVYAANNADGDFCGYAIVKTYSTTAGNWIDIVDFAADSPEVFAQLVDTLINRSRKQRDVLGLNVWANTHHCFAPILEKRGFVNAAPVTYFSFYAGNRSKVSHLYNRLSDYRHWYITMGDSDVY